MTNSTPGYAVVAGIMASCIFNNVAGARPVIMDYEPASSLSQYNPEAFEYSSLDNMFQKVRTSAIKRSFPLPHSFVLDMGYDVLSVLKTVNASLLFLNPLEDGGLMIEFEQDDVYFILEIANNEEIVLMRRSNAREAYNLTPDNFIDEIKKSLISE